MKVIENLGRKEKIENKAAQEKMFNAYEETKEKIAEAAKGEDENEIVLKTDIETYNKIWAIADEMKTENGSVLSDLFYNEKLTTEELDLIINGSLMIYRKKRKEIIMLATGKDCFTPQQEVALCGAIFRLACHIPAYMALNELRI